MVAHLSTLNRLESFTLEFEFYRFRPERESRHPPPTRTLIPALTLLKFKGAKGYAEDLVTRIDTPRLDNLDATFFNENRIRHLKSLPALQSLRTKVTDT